MKRYTFWYGEGLNALALAIPGAAHAGGYLSGYSGGGGYLNEYNGGNYMSNYSGGGYGGFNYSRPSVIGGSAGVGSVDAPHRGKPPVYVAPKTVSYGYSRVRQGGGDLRHETYKPLIFTPYE